MSTPPTTGTVGTPCVRFEGHREAADAMLGELEAKKARRELEADGLS